jgi:tetratricopeptide (TPR) repeat protein
MEDEPAKDYVSESNMLLENQGYALLTNSYSESENPAVLLNRGNAFMELQKPEQATQEFLKGVKFALKANDFKTLDVLYNNLSWSYQSLENYDEAIEYAQMALELPPNEAIEYLNLAHAQYALDDTSRAIENYRKVIEFDVGFVSAFDRLIELYFHQAEFDKVIELVEGYGEMEELSSETYTNIGLSYLYGQSKAEKAKNYLDKAYAMSPREIYCINGVAYYFEFLEMEKEREGFYLEALKDNQENDALLRKISQMYLEQLKYSQALEYVQKAMVINPLSHENFTTQLSIFSGQEDDQSYEQVKQDLMENCPESFLAYYDVGDYFYQKGDFYEALHWYEKALGIKPFDRAAAEGKLICLYYTKYYTDSIEFGQLIGSQFDQYSTHLILGYTFSALGKTDQAIEEYQKAYALEKDDSILLHLAEEYFVNQEYEKAIEATDTILENSSDNQRAVEVRKESNRRLNEFGRVIEKFIEENYFYYENNAQFEEEQQRIQEKNNIESDDVRRLFDATYLKGDAFSFLVDGQDYDEYINLQDESTVFYEKKEGGLHYLRINRFQLTTSNEFLDVIKEIEDTKESSIVIDLRGNYGGTTQSACDILDFLLGDCVVANLIFHNGYSYPYYSDEHQYRFKHIYLFTDRESASASELITLGLKTYLNNVTIIGETTYGKGVGQTVFEDDDRKFALFLVNHYWNVREVNIMDIGVSPTIPLNNASLDQYMSTLLQHMHSNDS